MSENGSVKLARKTVLVTDRVFFTSGSGELPKKPVSVSAGPWELEAELNLLGVVAKPSAKPAVEPGPDPTKLTGVWFKNETDVPF